jgi:hypothetical protein
LLANFLLSKTSKQLSANFSNAKTLVLPQLLLEFETDITPKVIFVGQSQYIARLLKRFCNV